MLNPHYAEWVRLTGGGPNHEFIIWCSNKWIEWRAEFGKPRYGASPEDREHFLSWLRGKSR